MDNEKRKNCTEKRMHLSCVILKAGPFYVSRKHICLRSLHPLV